MAEMHSLVFGRKRSGLSTGVKMRSVMIAAVGSGSGKTIVTAGLLMALNKRNIAVRSFKCGPDYIDPMFHTRVLGVPCRNLDLFLMGERGVLRELSGKEGSDILQETSGDFDDFAFSVKGRNAYFPCYFAEFL
jgi:cobyrinic acid a,c-diamide synthase